MNKKFNFEVGPIRPPSESESLLLRVTRNCPWNRCKFCPVYKQTKFSPRKVEEIKKDIDAIEYYKNIILKNKNTNGTYNHEDILKITDNMDYMEKQCFFSVYNWVINGEESVFLQDANSVVLKPDKLLEVLEYLKSKFPDIKRITSYGRADTLSRIDLDDLKKLKDAGLDRIHTGLESGSDNVLKLVNKGTTKEQQIIAGKKVKEAGIELSVYFMPGLGGVEYSEENALETADVINKINPDFIRIRTLVVTERGELYKDVEEGKFIKCSDLMKVNEIKLLISNLKGINSYILSDHILNLLQEVEGKLPEDKNKILDVIYRFENMNDKDKKIFQLARRMALVRSLDEINNPRLLSQVLPIYSEIKSDAEFESVIEELCKRYI